MVLEPFGTLGGLSLRTALLYIGVIGRGSKGLQRTPNYRVSGAIRASARVTFPYASRTCEGVATSTQARASAHIARVREGQKETNT